MNKLLNGKTTVSKAVKTLLWAGVSAAVVAVLSVVVDKPEMFSPTVVILANVLLVAVKNLVDPKVKNF